MTTHADLQPAGDRWQLRFTRRLAHPREKVWRAVTEAEHLTAWFPADVVGGREPGTALRFVFRDGEGPPTGGTVLAHEPPSLFELSWEGDVLRFELRPDGDAATVLDLLVTFDPLGRAARDGTGWHVCLDALALHLDGADTGPAEARWRAVHAEYERRFGPEASTIGPPTEPADRV